MKRDFPSQGELVVCTVDKVRGYGAFVTLDEYGKKGFIHVSEVASGWIRYIRNYIREGQKKVCKVLKVNPAKEKIELSLKGVSSEQKREKIKDWKNEQKARKLLKIGGMPEKITGILLDNYETLYDALEQTVIQGPDALVNIGIDKDSANTIHTIAADNIKIPRVCITGYVDLKCYVSNGVEVIRNALEAAHKIDGNIEIYYVGAPRYRIVVTAHEYKEAERILRDSAYEAIRSVEESGGEGKFYRKL